jgi:hypothetical protein
MRKFLPLFAVLAAVAMGAALTFQAYPGPTAHAQTTIVKCNDEKGYFDPALDPIDATISGAGTTYSGVYELRSLIGVGVGVTSTGTLAGTLTIESSNDNTNWYPVLGGSFTAITTAGGEQVEIGNLRSKYYRFKFVYGSGSGDLLVTAHFVEAGR